MKYSFYNDYSEGCHPRILEILTETNLSQKLGHGNDDISNKAKEAIKKHLGRSDVAIHFVSGGTQANLTALGAMVKPYQSIIAADLGHINVHETGAIEATGHKINTTAVENGKLSTQEIATIMSAHTDEHSVQPKVVFISQATELGTVYTKAELASISTYCRENGLYLYIDGARLGSALCSEGSDVTLADICQYADVFYIGGTKNGALLGEAIVIVNEDLKKDFRYHIKQRGALLAKGGLLGAQFLALFEENLYFDLARHANAAAKKLSEGIKKLGHGFLVESRTNQIFPILPNNLIERLEKLYGFYRWQKIDEKHSAIRLVTSWSTDDHWVDAFLYDIGS